MRKERRTFARIQLELPASLHLFHAEINHTGSILDLSQGGCFFPIDEEITVGEKCDINLTIGEGIQAESIQLTGIVARTTDRGIGIQFTNTSVEDHKQLGEVLGRYQ